MTTAKLKPAIADGHGLTPRIVDRIYDDLVAGRDPGTVIGLSEFQWGIDGDNAGTDGAFVHPDMNKAAVHHVKEFAYMVGVLADAPETATTDEDDEDES